MARIGLWTARDNSRLNLYRSITVVPTLESAFDLDTFTIWFGSDVKLRRDAWSPWGHFRQRTQEDRNYKGPPTFVNNRICMFLGKDGERRTGCRKRQ